MKTEIINNSKTVCCICGLEFMGYGNNPEPVVTKSVARCCDTCNVKVVLPERIRRFNCKKKEN